MNGSRLGIAAALLAFAAMFALSVPASAGQHGATPETNLLGMLAGSEVSTKTLASARGEGSINLSDVTNTTNNTLNVDATSSGSVNGGAVSGGITGSAGSSIVNSSGIINQFSNSGNNVMMSSSFALFIDAH